MSAQVPSKLEINSKYIDIQVRQYQQDDFPAISKIFREGMLFYTDKLPDQPTSADLEIYIQNSLKSDLKEIHEHYMDKGGNFWVATVQDNIENEPIVAGMIAVEKMEDNMGRLRRMSVAENYRRHGIGRRLINELENWAHDHNFNGIRLTTGAHMPQAITFYESMGYDIYLRQMNETYNRELVYLQKLFAKIEL